MPPQAGTRSVDILGAEYQRVGDIKSAIEVFKLNLLAYPDSTDAQASLADAYLDDGQRDLAREYAERALATLDSRGTSPALWNDTE